MDNQFMKTDRYAVKEELEKVLEKFRKVYFGDKIEALKLENERSNEMERSNKLSLAEQVVLGSMTGLVSGIIIEKGIEYIREGQQKIDAGQKVYDINNGETVTVIDQSMAGKLTVINDRGQKYEANRSETILTSEETGKAIDREMTR